MPSKNEVSGYSGSKKSANPRETLELSPLALIDHAMKQKTKLELKKRRMEK
jgi:hypothetical protein